MLTGTCGFRLMPTDALAEGPSTATLENVGAALVLRYSWTHPEDGEQHGLLLVGGATGEGDEPTAVTAAWSDTWHQQPGLMTVTGTRAEGLVRLAGTYGGDWGWEIDVDTTAPDALGMTMRNVIPASATEAMPPGMPPVEPGPYDVMVARWERLG